VAKVTPRPMPATDKPASSDQPAAPAPGAFSGKRIALAIGIDKYPNLATPADPARGQLHKAVNDARAIGKTLADLGFAVTVVENGTRADINRAVGRIEDGLKPGDFVFLFFAGHGIEIESANWLVPSDILPLVDTQGVKLSLRELKDATINAGDVIASLRSHNARTVIAVLDACREFIDPAKFRSIGVDSKGLAPMTPPEGTFILFSAGARQLALDSLSDRDRDPNSIFTRSLLPLLREPGLPFDDLATRLRAAAGRRRLAAGGQRKPPAAPDLLFRHGRVPGAGGALKPRQAQPARRGAKAFPAEVGTGSAQEMRQTRGI